MDKCSVAQQLNIYGRVQGVGFRPSVCRLAQGLQIRGLVRNMGNGVEIIAQGSETKLQTFTKAIQNLERPVFVEKIVVKELTQAEFQTLYDVNRGQDFYVVESSNAATENPVVPADIGICPECEKELLTKGNRRYGYPYISCAQCGPRYSTINRLPYDRATTTMAEFQMCGECEAEYQDMADRRGRAETISCWHCGPQLQGFVKGQDAELKGEAVVAQACALLQQDKIIIAKTLGGFNLLCRADKEEVVQKLRDLKQRPSKPLVVVLPSVERVQDFCYVSDKEKEFLQSGVRPIVLLQKRSEHLEGIAENVAGGTAYLGVFLPPLGLYSLLARKVTFPIIATSCNFSGSPIIIDDQEARTFYDKNGAVAGFFTYNRTILRPADDSVIQWTVVSGQWSVAKVQILRRTRGYLPEPILTPRPSILNPESSPLNPCPSLLATGAQMEPGFCLTMGNCFYPAQVPGEAEEFRTAEMWRNLEKDWEDLLHIQPKAMVADLHPNYDSTRWGKKMAEERNLPFFQVQHHQAHVLSVVAEHGLTGPVLGVAFDGTGYGADGTVWGGEFLLCEGTEMQRLAHLESTILLGGDDSMHQAWKTALAYLYAGDCYPEKMNEKQALIKAALQNKVNIIPNSSMGRVFDAVASILDLGDVNTHQGCCAQRLEQAAVYALANNLSPLELHFGFDEKRGVFSPKTLWRDLLNVNKKDYGQVAKAALGFHYAVAEIVTLGAELVRKLQGVEQVALSGGCFVNRVLCQRVWQELTARKFKVYMNEQVSPGDGGITLGQAYYGSLLAAKGGW